MDWRKASVPKKNTPMLMRSAVLADENEIPDNHVLTVRDRVLSTDLQRIVQNNVRTDTVTLDLDGEWDDCTVYVTFNDGTFQSGPWSLEWKGQPLTIPSAIGAVVGPVAVSVVGYGSDGELRLVTEAAPSLLNVVKSGYVEIVDDNEENKDILSQMVAAGQAAEDAAEAANAAAMSATSAATKANSAANSADTAASSANSAATKANAAAVGAQNAYDTLKPYMATIDSCANILHREVGPDAVVTADDAFPCKPVEMVVYGNTAQNLWVNPSGTHGGITVTSNADGSVTVSGTTVYPNIEVSSDSFILVPGKQYTLSINKKVEQTLSGANFLITFINASGSQISFEVARISGTTFTVPENTVKSKFKFYAGTTVSSDNTQTVSGTYRVMLNEGSTAEPWCPPGLNSVGDDGSVDIVTAGKNLLKPREDLQPTAINGITFTPNEDGTVTVNGTATANDTDYYIVGVSWTVRADASLPANDLVFSTNGRAKMYGYDSDGAGVISAIINNGQMQIAASKAQACDKMVVYLSYAAGQGESNKRVYVQLELGSTATAYESPNITTTTIDLQGHTLNALPDGTRDELHIDGGGNVVLEKRTWSEVFDGTENWIDSTTRYGLNTGATFATTADTVIRDKQLADTLPVVDVISRANGIRTFSSRWVDAGIASIQGDLAGFKSWLGNNNTTLIYKLAEPQTIDLGTITPPTMAAPNVTAYVADDTPAEMSLDYVRDVNIVHSRLEERVAALELASATS